MSTPRPRDYRADMDSVLQQIGVRATALSRLFEDTLGDGDAELAELGEWAYTIAVDIVEECAQSRRRLYPDAATDVGKEE